MKLLILVLFVTAIHAKHEIYSGWKSFLVKPVSHDQLSKLTSKIAEFDLDFVSNVAVNREGIVLVKPQYQVDFLKFLSEENISNQIHSEDLKKQFEIDDQKIEARKLATRSVNGGRIPYDNYQTLDVIYEYIDKIAEDYPETVTLVSSSKSFEGRPLKYLKISKDKFASNKPVIFIDAGIHAREWISPPTVTYAIHKLVENVTEPDLLENFDWILFPVVNPDGYVYTFERERMWRKTRSTDQNVLSQVCPGVDGNRNFNFLWNTIGTSNNPCSDIYAGSKPFSEVESRTVGEIIDEHLDRMVLFITMHSYGSMILYPWGHNGTLSHNAFSLHTVGIGMADAINKLALPNFPNYVVGNGMLILNYAVAGAAEDYAHYRGIPLTYTFELPGLRSGFGGFHLDPIYIHQVCIETWESFVIGARRAGELYGKKNL
ncbi:carboxypeptidase B-like isoform X1 [Vanessa atalanta]|uniref:carboxypeptidase B-like isoform X1 n=1 Tax=Vanessa atalanta TaxID=42275 RepID=UPI001FCD4483|nr:carboxypeptidase B-like isoform X1 [Vanessa atalanta]